MPDFLINADGREVPVGKVRKDHLKRHNAVEACFKDVEGLQKKLLQAKKRLMQRVQRYQKWVAKYNEIEPDFENLTLSNYSNTRRVVISSAKVIEFDDNLQVAKQYIDKCFERWGKSADANLKLLIDGYFKVGKKGFIDKASILGLFQYQINDADWVKAMEYIRLAISVVDRKQYVVLQERADNKAVWGKINLNFSTTEAE